MFVTFKERQASKEYELFSSSLCPPSSVLGFRAVNFRWKDLRRLNALVLYLAAAALFPDNNESGPNQVDGVAGPLSSF